MINTVIFDLDDTLYDEVDYCRSGFKAVAHFLDEILGRGQSTPLFEALCREFDAGKRGTTFNEALTRLGIAYDTTLIRSLVRVYRTHKPNLRLPQDSRKVLKDLRSDYRLAILTDGFLPAQRLKVRALKLDCRFENILYTENLGRDCWKPSAIGFERLLAQMGVAPSQAAYVGDNARKDFLAPNRLGMVSIQVCRAHALHREPAEHPQGAARVRLETLGHLPVLLKSLGSYLPEPMPVPHVERQQFAQKRLAIPLDDP
jgi:putative hydrolase of the HAD superfamily